MNTGIADFLIFFYITYTFEFQNIYICKIITTIDFNLHI